MEVIDAPEACGSGELVAVANDCESWQGFCKTGALDPLRERPICDDGS